MKNIEDQIFIDDDELENADFTYDLTPYHFNMDVDGLLRRFGSKDILIPSFQRNYVWTKDGASMFIDSLLRGLPTPSLFFYEEKPRKYLVIDGQQRLLSLYYFIRGVFPDNKQHQNVKINNNSFDIDFSALNDESITGIPFTLSGKKILSIWKGKTFSELTPEQQKRITDTYIYIINLKQTSPVADNSSMYLVFERINTGSTPLNPQQIRLCVSHGKYANFICEKAKDKLWYQKFKINDTAGLVSELILRFISLYYVQGQYKGSMKSFLDKSLKENRNFELHSEEEIEQLFSKSFFVLTKLFDNISFTPKKSLIGYYLLVTWISIANLLINVTDIEEWFQSNNQKIINTFEKLKQNDSVIEFITNTRRASNSASLVPIIEIITSKFKEAINGTI